MDRLLGLMSLTATNVNQTKSIDTVKGIGIDDKSALILDVIYGEL
jgi:hypothetical protein